MFSWGQVGSCPHMRQRCPRPGLAQQRAAGPSRHGTSPRHGTKPLFLNINGSKGSSYFECRAQVIEFVDAGGNRVHGQARAVSAALGAVPPPGAATLTGAGAAPRGDLAAFTNLAIDHAGAGQLQPLINPTPFPPVLTGQASPLPSYLLDKPRPSLVLTGHVALSLPGYTLRFSAEGLGPAETEPFEARCPPSPPLLFSLPCVLL